MNAPDNHLSYGILTAATSVSEGSSNTHAVFANHVAVFCCAPAAPGA
jgi:hypothetical protein